MHESIARLQGAFDDRRVADFFGCTMAERAVLEISAWSR